MAAGRVDGPPAFHRRRQDSRTILPTAGFGQKFEEPSIRQTCAGASNVNAPQDSKPMVAYNGRPASLVEPRSGEPFGHQFPGRAPKVVGLLGGVHAKERCRLSCDNEITEWKRLKSLRHRGGCVAHQLQHGRRHGSDAGFKRGFRDWREGGRMVRGHRHTGAFALGKLRRIGRANPPQADGNALPAEL